MEVVAGHKNRHRVEENIDSRNIKLRFHHIMFCFNKSLTSCKKDGCQLRLQYNNNLVSISVMNSSVIMNQGMANGKHCGLAHEYYHRAIYSSLEVFPR
jgi:hypothetical protein